MHTDPSLLFSQRTICQLQALRLGLRSSQTFFRALLSLLSRIPIFIPNLSSHVSSLTNHSPSPLPIHLLTLLTFRRPLPSSPHLLFLLSLPPTIPPPHKPPNCPRPKHQPHNPTHHTPHNRPRIRPFPPSSCPSTRRRALSPNPTPRRSVSISRRRRSRGNRNSENGDGGCEAGNGRLVGVGGAGVLDQGVGDVVAEEGGGGGGGEGESVAEEVDS